MSMMYVLEDSNFFMLLANFIIRSVVGLLLTLIILLVS